MNATTPRDAHVCSPCAACTDSEPHCADNCPDIPTAQVIYLDAPPDPTEVQHVGWFGRTRTVQATLPLGLGVDRAPEYGIHRALFDIAYGYVSGFRLRDIAYYIATRSLSRRICHAVIRWEQRRHQVL
tara:strand:- start:4294 stop:4677 length:384 start_codon:yes stop_codon:yes gene_type:complete